MAIGDWRLAIRTALLGLSLCLGLLVVACEISPTEQFTPKLVVHGLVRPGLSAVETNINRNYAIDEPFDTVFPGASGIVWRGNDTWTLAHSRRDVYSTSDLESGPAPGDTFGIRVAKDGFDTVYGHTVVPDSFRILFPRSGDTVTLSDSMVWTRSRDCAGYYMSFRSVEEGDTFYYGLAIPNDTTGDNFDSLVFTLTQMVFLYLFDPGEHTLRVFALDTNYFDWVSAGGFGPGTNTGETTYLSGGIGVFGSGVGESVEVYVERDTAAQRTERTVRPGPSRPSQKSEGGMQRSEVPDRHALEARGLRPSPGATRVRRLLPRPASRPQPANPRR